MNEYPPPVTRTGKASTFPLGDKEVRIHVPWCLVWQTLETIKMLCRVTLGAFLSVYVIKYEQVPESHIFKGLWRKYLHIRKQGQKIKTLSRTYFT